MSDLAHLDHFFVSQRITMMVNRYEIRAAAPDGSEGPVVAMAQQKRMAFKEQVTFYADEDRKQPAFGFKARRRIDLGATYDVTDADGQAIGWFRKQFGRSLLRSTWEMSTLDGGQVTGSERSAGVAIARRLWEVLPVVENLPSPFLFHFDFTDASGQVVMSSVRKRSLRDRYEVTVPGGRVDGRVAAAMAVALDALQSR
jgi:uncharacterized protein YxjI